MIRSTSTTRRTFLETAARTSLIAPWAGPLVVAGCTSENAPATGTSEPKPASKPSSKPASASITGGTPAGVPLGKPPEWDPVAFNTERGRQGAIPESYMDDITGPDGVKKHLGKHLPYQPQDVPADRLTAGYLAIMWGDPAKGYAMHPNAARSTENPEGHWYNWIRVAKAGDDTSEVETRFDDWPKPTSAVKGRIVGFKSPDPAEDSGKNTVYLTLLPDGAKPGDTLRIWAHCLTHGEYVDFLTLA